MLKESAPYAAEWQALREQRQKEYERLVTMGQWGDLLEITNEIAKECSVQNTGVQQTEEYSPVSNLPTNPKGRV